MDSYERFVFKFLPLKTHPKFGLQYPQLFIRWLWSRLTLLGNPWKLRTPQNLRAVVKLQWTWHIMVRLQGWIRSGHRTGNSRSVFVVMLERDWRWLILQPVASRSAASKPSGINLGLFFLHGRGAEPPTAACCLPKLKVTFSFLVSARLNLPSPPATHADST